MLLAEVIEDGKRIMQPRRDERLEEMDENFCKVKRIMVAVRKGDVEEAEKQARRKAVVYQLATDKMVEIV
jgi:hypothetical protein